METIVITMAEAKRILDWRARMRPEEEKEHWSEADDALAIKLLNFVDD